MEERLQKLIARAGICSRREAEQLLLDGHVTLNGEVITELGTKADPERDHIKVNGKLLHQEERAHYILLNKPKGVISTVNDPEGRPSVVELVVGVKSRIYPVGRLDFNTEGVLLLTNDGELANRMLSPSFKCPKTYLVKVHGVPGPKAISRLERGITVDGTRYGSCDIEVLRVVKNTWLKVVLTEGKNHQVKKMFEAIGHPVSKLRRIAFGFLTAKGVGVGEWRYLTEVEVARLKRDDFKPLVPVAANSFLKDVGVRVTLKDREKLLPYRAEKGEEERERPKTTRRADGKSRDNKGPSRGSKWLAKRTSERGRFSQDRDRRPGARSSGGRDERDERPSRDGRGGRDERPYRDARGGRDERPYRDARGGRDERPSRDARGGRDERPSRDARGGRDERPSRDARGGRDERPYRDARGGRDERPYRDARGGRDERPSRDARGGRDERPSRDARGGRDERPSRDARGGRDERPSRDARGGRDERPSRDARGGRNERPSRDGRGGRPSGEGREDRGNVWAKRGEARPSRDDRPSDRGGPWTKRNDDRRERPEGGAERERRGPGTFAKGGDQSRRSTSKWARSDDRGRSGRGEERRGGGKPPSGKPGRGGKPGGGKPGGGHGHGGGRGKNR